MKPVVGIGGNDRFMSVPDAHWTAYTPKSFVDGIQQAGGIALIFPITEDPETIQYYISSIDKLLLTGGQDVAPEFYHQAPHQKLGAVYPARDRFEIALIQEALKQDKPIFGVCRGMQLLNVAFGGTLLQDLSLKEHAIKHDQLPTPFQIPTHTIQITSESRLAKIVGTNYSVNSFHHQAIDQLADGFVVTASAPDGIIEGIESTTKKIMGIQWHPELAHAVIPSEQSIFDFFVHEF